MGSYDPTPLTIRVGRGFLYDAKLSGNGTGACAACHIDSDMDHLAWDLGDPGGSMEYVKDPVEVALHPMKGPMTTLAMRGAWSTCSLITGADDKANFADFNTDFSQLLGGSQLSAADMTTFQNFISSRSCSSRIRI